MNVVESPTGVLLLRGRQDTSFVPSLPVIARDPFLDSAAAVPVHVAAFEITFTDDNVGVKTTVLVAAQVATVPLMAGSADRCLGPTPLLAAHVVVAMGFQVVFRENMQEGGFTIFVESDRRWHSGTAPFRIPDLTLLLRVIEVDRRSQDFPVGVADFVGFQVDLHVGEIVFLLVGYLLIVAWIVKAFGFG